jgi:N-acetylmuramoyl-L-alanine amidase
LVNGAGKAWGAWWAEGMQKHLQHDMRRALIALVWLFGLAIGALTATNAVADPGSVHRKNVAVEAKRAEIKSDAASTKFLLGLSAGVRAEIFTLAEPYRVVIDLPDVAFQLPDGTGQKGQGLISGFRYGLLAEGKARVVIDTTGPVVLKRADMTSKGGSAVELALELGATSAKSFGVGTGGGRTAAAPAKADPPSVPKVLKKDRAKPIVLIDAGHGGIDPGAAGASNLKEKTLVLAVAHALKAQLSASGRYDLRMTRSTDVFISLDQRLKMSRDLDADLFISLHADSIAQKGFAKAVRGATVYTLSEQASDEEARRMAEKENNSDAIAGLQTAKFEEEGEVRNILIDLLKRETSNFSADFSNTLVKRLGTSISLSGRPQRSAAFKVLRQADTPSVLVELGYMSNPEDERLLNSADWQRRVAAAIGTAVDSYFSKRTAKAR